MKKKVLAGIFILFFLISLTFVIAQDETDDEKVSKAYDCLSEKVADDCDTISTEEKIFTFLAIRDCKSELIGDSNENKCWPKQNCNIKTTAQAIFALADSGTNTNEAEDWLLSQNQSPTNLIWYLEIESPDATSCTVTYSGASHTINIGEDKKLSGAPGSCLSLAQDNYWLRISPVCYGLEFDVSCSDDFLTTLLFTKTNSQTIHVSADSHSASSGGTTNEKIDSSCFAQGNTCDYEGTLWATLALDSLDYEVSSFLPYLITMTDDNRRFLPGAFLCHLTGDAEYCNSILTRQKSNKYWEESGNKYYDTAVASFPFTYEQPTEKTNSEQWLLGVQDSEGCWENNIRDTAFILFSIFPRTSTPPIEEDDCELSSFHCRSEDACLDDGGLILGGYYCSAGFVCCDKEQVVETCDEQNGETCVSGEYCTGTVLPASDTSQCCIGGNCQESNTGYDCEDNYGRCDSFCEENEDEDLSYDCDLPGEVCCFSSTTQEEGGSYTWIWILLLLIFLVVLGIVFKDKLRPFWFRLKSGKRPRGPPGPEGIPLVSPSPPGPMPRRYIPPRSHPPMRRPPRRNSGEMDEVLKKLREMGK